MIREYIELLGLDIEYRIVFIDNEPINNDYILYRFHVVPENLNKYIGVRIIGFRGVVKKIMFVFDKELTSIIDPSRYKKSINIDYDEIVRREGRPEGQRYIPDFIVYRSLGQPRIDLDKWFLEITGLVEKLTRYRYEDLLNMGLTWIIRDFHCVTGWSIGNVVFDGIPVKKLVEDVKIKPEAKWVYVIGLDGYLTSIPLKDFMVDDALIVLKINGRELSIEQGFQARLFIPHLYGWKGVFRFSSIGEHSVSRMVDSPIILSVEDAVKVRLRTFYVSRPAPTNYEEYFIAEVRSVVENISFNTVNNYILTQ